MTCDFMSFLTVFQSYHDDGWVKMEACVQWNPDYDWYDPRLKQVLNPAGQRSTFLATVAPLFTS